MVKKPRELPSDSKVPSSKKSPRDVAADEKKWSEIYHQQAKLRKEKEEVGACEVTLNRHIKKTKTYMYILSNMFTG